MRMTLETKYGKIIGEDLGLYGVNVRIEGEEKRGVYNINKRVEYVTEDDLLKASEEIMAREVKVEE